MNMVTREIEIKNSQSIFFRAIDIFGREIQKDMIIEECGELICAIQHYKRGKNTIEDVIDEIADVQIMIEQAKMMYDPCGKYYNNRYQEKINRLEKTLEDYELKK